MTWGTEFWDFVGRALSPGASVLDIGAGSHPTCAPWEADVFVRVLTPPQGSVVDGRRAFPASHKPTFRLRVDDPTAIGFACNVDHAPLAFCSAGQVTLRRARPGRHVLHVRAIGPGMLPQPRELKIRFTVTRR